MEPQTEAVELVISSIRSDLNLFAQISMEELPEEGGIYAEIRPAYNISTYLNNGVNQVIPLIFKCKHTVQKTAVDTIYAISNYLQRIGKYPDGTSFSWINAELVESEPETVGKQSDGKYIYSCRINIIIHF